MSDRTTVHLLRHGEVHNPGGVLYGRMEDFHLSDLGRQMADRVADYLSGHDIAAVYSSPLERAQETATPVATAHGHEIRINPDLIEAANVFEGQRVSVGDGVLKQPSTWKHLYNPLKPSWGEPYVDIAARMRAAIRTARESAPGHEVVCVSHQLPVWVARLDAEQRRFAHDPRKRQCSLASLTSLTFEADRLISVTYTEPAADLVEMSSKGTGA